MSFTDQEIFNFSLFVQCKLADKGEEISKILKYKDLCIKDKLDFVLAHTYNKIIRNYNTGSCISDEDLCKMISFLKKYLKQVSYSNNNCNCN